MSELPCPLGDLISQSNLPMRMSGLLVPGILLLGMSSISYPILVRRRMVLYSCFSSETPLGMILPGFIYIV